MAGVRRCFLVLSAAHLGAATSSPTAQPTSVLTSSPPNVTSKPKNMTAPSAEDEEDAPAEEETPTTAQPVQPAQPTFSPTQSPSVATNGTSEPTNMTPMAPPSMAPAMAPTGSPSTPAVGAFPTAQPTGAPHVLVPAISVEKANELMQQLVNTSLAGMRVVSVAEVTQDAELMQYYEVNFTNVTDANFTDQEKDDLEVEFASHLGVPADLLQITEVRHVVAVSRRRGSSLSTADVVVVSFTVAPIVASPPTSPPANTTAVPTASPLFKKGTSAPQPGGPSLSGAVSASVAYVAVLASALMHCVV